MKTQILKGSKQEIAESIARMNGEVREAIVFLEEPAGPANAPASHEGADLFAEMQPYMADVENVDDSRASIYTRAGGE